MTGEGQEDSDASRQERTEEKEPPRENARAGEGLLRHEVEVVPDGEAAGREVAPVCLSRPKGAQTRLPRPLDRPYKRGRARERDVLQPSHGRVEEGGERHQPQDARRSGGDRPDGVPPSRRGGEAGARRRVTAERGPDPADDTISKLLAA